MVLYIDEPIRNFFFKKFLTKENIKYGDDNMSINEKEVKQLATEIMSEGCDRKKKVKVKKEGKWNELPIKERYALLSKVIFDTKDLTHIGAEVATLTEKISNQIVEQSDGDWFDKHTLKRNATEITRKGQEFHKSSAELKSVFERMQALYEEIGMLIERYL